MLTIRVPFVIGNVLYRTCTAVRTLTFSINSIIIAVYSTGKNAHAG